MTPARHPKTPAAGMGSASGQRSASGQSSTSGQSFASDPASASAPAPVAALSAGARAILAVAKQLFADKGVDAVSMNDIAQQTPVCKANVL